MATNNFKYVTTPTGSLSGASMARQTEDAINSVANTAEVARVTVLEAQTTIEGALNTAQNAQAAAEAGLIEIRNALQQLSQMNIPSGDGQVGKFLSTDGTRLLWQAGIRRQHINLGADSNFSGRFDVVIALNGNLQCQN